METRTQTKAEEKAEVIFKLGDGFKAFLTRNNMSPSEKAEKTFTDMKAAAYAKAKEECASMKADSYKEAVKFSVKKGLDVVRTVTYRRRATGDDMDLAQEAFIRSRAKQQDYQNAFADAIAGLLK